MGRMGRSVLVWAGVESISSPQLAQCCVWVQGENDVDNSLMIWLLPNCVYPKSRTFLCLMFCQWGRTKKQLVREQSWERWIFHTLKPVPSASTGELPRGGVTWGSDTESGICQGVVRNCILHHLFVFLLLFIILMNIYYHCNILLCFNY